MDSIELRHDAATRLLGYLEFLSSLALERHSWLTLYGDDELSPQSIAKIRDSQREGWQATAGILLGAGEQVLEAVGSLRELQSEVWPRLELAYVELAKQQQVRAYSGAWPSLESLAYAMRRWAMEFGNLWHAPEVEVLGSPARYAFEAKRESCPWDDVKAGEIRQMMLAEKSQLLRDLPTYPLVTTPGNDPPTSGKKQQGGERRRKRNAGELTDAQEKFAAVLRDWHKYESGSLSCTNCEPIAYDELCRRSGVKSKATATEFFDSWFPEGGNAKYRGLCERDDAKALAIELAKLSREGMLSVLQLVGDTIAAKAKRPGDDD